MTWLSTSEFYEISGITGADSLIARALEFAEKDIIKHIFISRDFTTCRESTDHVISYTYPMDIDGDKVITTSDLDVYSLDSDGVRRDLNEYKQDFIEKEMRLILSEAKPADNRTMHIEFKEGREWFANMLLELQEAEALLASNWIFNKNPISKLQTGISEWSLNGVNVRFDSAEMRQIVEDNKKEIEKLFKQLRPRRFSGVKPGYYNEYDGFRRRKYGNTPMGSISSYGWRRSL